MVDKSFAISGECITFAVRYKNQLKRNDMATIIKTLSTKVNKDNGKSELLFRITNGRAFRLRYKTGIYVPVRRWNDKKQDIIIPASLGNVERTELINIKTSISKYEAIIFGLCAKFTPEEVTTEFIKNMFDNCKEDNITLLSKDSIIAIAFPDAVASAEEQKKHYTIYDRMEEYIEDEEKDFSYDHKRAFRVLMRDIARFELYQQNTNKDYRFDIDKVTSEDIVCFRAYIKDEFRLMKKYPKLFKQIQDKYPLLVNVKRKSPEMVERGNNTIVKLIKKLRAFYTWLREKKYTTNDPFFGIKIGSESYDEEIYCLSKKERDLIALFPLTSETLQVQRDIFIFHCLVGCRIGDLYRLNERNINEDEDGDGYVLTYTPHKTKDNKTSSSVKVPLVAYAYELKEKYKGIDPDGRLFPFISEDKYRRAIKKILTECGITRTVPVRNSITGEIEYKPINEIASSHMARKTFVDISYKKAKDPNIVAAMSGHVENSKVFSRYRKIDNKDKREVLEETEVNSHTSDKKALLEQLLSQMSEDEIRQLLDKK